MQRVVTKTGKAVSKPMHAVRCIPGRKADGKKEIKGFVLAAAPPRRARAILVETFVLVRKVGRVRVSMSMRFVLGRGKGKGREMG